MTLFDSVEFFSEMKGLTRKWDVDPLDLSALQSYQADEGVAIKTGYNSVIGEYAIEDHLVKKGNLYFLHRTNEWHLNKSYHSPNIINLLRILEGSLR